MLNNIVPHFFNAEDEILKEFKEFAFSKKFNKGEFLTMEGDVCEYFPIVKSGTVRVYKLGQNGQEFTLYRINVGESCILTISSILSNKEFPALAFVEEDCEVYLIPSDVFNGWISKYEIWNKYIFDYMSGILNRVINLMEGLVFRRTDLRIIEHILNITPSNNNSINVTHQEIANELGTAREVVSRILKNLESENLISISRGMITLSDKTALQNKVKMLQ